MARYQTFDEFWPYYLSEHSHPVNRGLHLVGITSALACGVLAAVLWNGWFLLLGAALGYTFGWIGHFLVEGNRPATLGYPLWSMRAGLRFYGLLVTGRLPPPVR